MFYKALGFAVWKLGISYLRRRYGRAARLAGLVAVATLIAGYIAARAVRE
jgi:hypothetical protein